MSNKRRKLMMILTLLMAIALPSGCNKQQEEAVEIVPMEKEESRGYSFDFLGGKDVMPIGGFYGPYTVAYSKNGNRIPDYVTEEIFERISEAGINLIVASADTYPGRSDQIIKSLELGEQFGIGVFVQDTNLLKGLGNTTYPVTSAANTLVNYYDYESFCGIHLVDEPTTSYYGTSDGSRDISRYGYLAQLLEDELKIPCYVNLLPVGTTASEKENYAAYVEEFCKTLHPKFLTWDHYIFDKARNENYGMYFWNMDVIRQYSEKYNIPFWSFIQAGSQWAEGGLTSFDSDGYFPNEAQFNWNINTSLAFGAQGIQYFPLIQPYYFAYGESTEWDFERNGIIGAWGNKTQWYNYAQNINKQIAAIDEVLMNAVNKGIIVSGAGAVEETKTTTCVIASGTFQELMSVTGDAMVGCFNYNGKTALYVVNYSMEYAQYITLELNDRHNIKTVQNAEETYLKTKMLTLDMAAGEGVLVIID